MNKKSIFRNLVVATVLSCTSLFSYAGNGSSTSPYSVCAASGYKLVASSTIASGGTVAAAGYRWKDDAGTVLTETSSTLSVTAATTPVTTITTLHYKVEASSSVGCYSDPQDIYVTLVPKPTLTAPTLANVCALVTNGTATTVNLTAPTSSAPTLPTGVSITFGDWSGPATIVQGTTNGTATATVPAAAGSYTYSITSSYSGLDVAGTGCNVTSTAGIVIDPIPTAPTSTISSL